MKDLLEFIGGAVLQGFVDAKKFRKNHKGSGDEKGKAGITVLKTILIIIAAAAAAAGLIYLLVEIILPKLNGKESGKTYSFLPFGHGEDDPDEDDDPYEDDPDIVKDLDRDA